ncbi:MAG: hypothetical protein ACOZE5_14105 [Verrucomicrobiota bacterium]
MQSTRPACLAVLGSLASLLLGLVLTGCITSHTYTVQVDAIAAPAETGPSARPAQSYHILTRNPQLDEKSLRYKEVADYVRTALSGKGMYEAPSPEKADVLIDIDYGMDAPRIKFETYSNPVVIEVAGNVREEQVAIRDTSGNLVGYRTVYIQEPSRNEFMGMRESVQPVLIYEKYLRLSARSNREADEGRPAPEVWSVSVSTEDGGQELRKYMPILASATADYIGRNTKEEKPVKVGEGDETVAFIKKGL